MFTAQPHETLVWHDGRAVTRAGFTYAARQLAARLPDSPLRAAQQPDSLLPVAQQSSAGYCINLCAGRLAFLLGWTAAALRGQVTLLPPNQTAVALETLRGAHPGSYTLDDSCLAGLDWQSAAATRAAEPIDIEPTLTIAVLYTSGSTGVPVAHSKSWFTLARTGDLDAARFVGNQAMNLVATVPGQHMFGLQTTLLLPIRSRCAIHDSRPFFPADIRAALESVPAPRALITTPAQLRVCLAAGIELPPLEFILSATAPLPADMAAAAEARWRTQVLEIYGSTEAGAMATRRATHDDSWQLIDGARIETHPEGSWFHAAHLPEPLLLSDHVELQGEQRFRLLGRSSDLIKIAGKRAALGDLTQALLSIAGVEDGVVFLPQGAERTAALVVAPQLTSAQIQDTLALQIDPVFLPRPLLQVARLPRNEIGKLTQAALQAILQSAP
jgi:acyl-coenzyme A synthetase/AMP-(fatty) acid ligase